MRKELKVIDHWRRDEYGSLEESPDYGPMKFVLLKDFLPTNSKNNVLWPFYALVCIKYCYELKPSDALKSSHQYYPPYDSNGKQRFISFEQYLKELEETDDKIFMKKPTISTVRIVFVIGTITNFGYQEKSYQISEDNFLSMIQEGYCKIVNNMSDFYIGQKYVFKPYITKEMEDIITNREEIPVVLGRVDYELNEVVFNLPTNPNWNCTMPFRSFFNCLYDGSISVI